MSMKRLTSNQDHFANVPSADIQRSVFQRDHTHKTTFNCGRLIPFYLDEVLPGDTFQIDTAFVARTTTPIFPVMDDLEIEFFYFHVPNRLVWQNWQELHGENKTTAWAPTTPPALAPVLPGGAQRVGIGTLGDYFGLPDLPMGALGTGGVSVLPFRAYALIWNEWFRDQNLQSPISINTGSGSELLTAAYLPYNQPFLVNKKHDYFTSCLPAPQKGTSVYLPLGTNAPVTAGNNHDISDIPMRIGAKIGGSIAYPTQDSYVYAQGGGLGNVFTASANGSFSPSGYSAPTNLWADLSQATASTVAQLRQAFQLQRLFERDARGGTRYTEIIRSHFGVVSPDSRLQRPEYLGGFKEYIGMQQIPQTSSTDNVSPQGNTAAFSLTSGVNRGVHQSFTEHGYVIGLLTVRNRKTYSQGIERMWFKRDRFDFYYPALAHISEQPVYTREIYANTDTMYGSPTVFGYQEAWAEYRYKPNRVSGYFRPGIDGTLDSWHYADYYAAQPTLSSSWIADNTSQNVDRTLSVNSSLAPQIIADILIKNRATRPMPVYSVPGLIDHF